MDEFSIYTRRYRYKIQILHANIIQQKKARGSAPASM
jgi:hypothetical protein